MLLLLRVYTGYEYDEKHICSSSWPILPSEELHTQAPREWKGLWFANAICGRPVASTYRGTELPRGTSKALG